MEPTAISARLRSMRRALLSFLALVLVLVGGAAAAPCAMACSCAPATPAKEIADSDLVAEVSVLSVREEGMERVYDIEARRIWKGPDRASLVVRTQSQSSACGVRMTKGKTYLLFATGDGQAYHASSCGGTAATDTKNPRVSRLDVVSRLGEGRVPPPVVAGEPTSSSAPTADGAAPSAGGQPSDDEGSSDQAYVEEARPSWVLLVLVGGLLLAMGVGVLAAVRRSRR